MSAPLLDEPIGVVTTGGGDERVAVRGHNVYVVVSTTDWGKRAIPEGLRSALSPQAPDRPVPSS